MKYSIIVATVRGVKALKPLFIAPIKDAELIIADSAYNKEKLEFLRKQEGYEQICYVPVSSHPYNFNRDFSHALNVALSYAEADWIIRADDSLEFKYDFEERLEHTINTLKTQYNKFLIIAQKAREEAGESKFVDYFSIRGVEPQKELVNVVNPDFTFSFGAAPLSLYLEINGYDIKYDCGWANDDADFLHRALRSGYDAILDKKLFGYLHKRSGARGTSFTERMNSQFLYLFQKLDIMNGKVWAYNPYSLKKLRETTLLEKDKYIC